MHFTRIFLKIQGEGWKQALINLAQHSKEHTEGVCYQDQALNDGNLALTGELLLVLDILFGQLPKHHRATTGGAISGENIFVQVPEHLKVYLGAVRKGFNASS